MRTINKISVRIAFLTLGVFLINGCSDDYLQDNKRDAILDSTVYLSDEGATAALTGVYDVLQGGPDEFITKAIFYPANFLTQDYLNVGADKFFQTFEIPPTFSPFQSLWAQNYAGILRANTAIVRLPDNIENKNINAELGERLLGEAYGLRGLLYSILASNFGGVPISTKPSDGSTNLYAPRNTQDEVFQQIVLDMKEAVKRLPWTYGAKDKGRFTKGAAYAYMGNAYMWLGQYQDAVDTYEKMDSYYSLENDFLDVHKYSNKNGKESIFEIQFLNVSGNLSWNRDDNVTFIQSFSMPWEISGNGSYSAATKVLYDSFEPGDKRKLASVIGPGDEHPDPLIQISDYPFVKKELGGINTAGTVAKPWLGQDNLSGRQGYYNVKLWRNPNVDGWGGARVFGDQNIILIRYGEVLLSLAESYHRAGNTGKAMQTLMRVRNRAGLTTEPTGDFLRVMLQAYRHELAGEFSAWWLYRRNGQHIQFLKNEFGVTVPSGRDLLPIPQQEIDSNPNLKQNPGY